MVVRSGLIDTAFDKVVPPKDLLGPQLERIKHVEITSISQGQLVLAELDEPVDGLVVVVEKRVGDELIDSIHLKPDFSIHRNLSANNCITKAFVINRYSRV
jgi:L-fucose mutarotase/ribose pyranase (RbsD/FucU family)